MDKVLAELLDLLALESHGADRFVGQSHDIGTPQVFGGQVLGQALNAACHTIDGRLPHSLHAYFLRRGDVTLPIIYEVDRARDGASFSSRRVVALQTERPIFHLAASFQKPEGGIEHQSVAPEVAGPDGLADRYDVGEEVLAKLHAKMRAYLTRKRPFYVRPVKQMDLLNPEITDPVKHVWIKSADPLPDDPVLHRILFAYVSDYELLGTATLPHDVNFTDGNVQMASLDHAIWFHRDFRVDEWLLFSFDSPNASAARGLARAAVYNQSGVLVASTAQEGLIRVREKPGGPLSVK